MLSPAQKHYLNTMAKRHASGEETPRERTAYERMLHRLRLDKSELHRIMSNTAKAKRKALMLPEYDDWVDGVLSGNRGGADEVITTLMTWYIDAGHIDRALEVGEYILRHKLPMPDNYRRTPATVLVEEICAPVLAAFKADPKKALHRVETLHRLNEVTEAEDMPDEVRAKLYKCLGYSLRLNEDEESRKAALSYLRQAISLSTKIGVQRDIELLERDLKKQPAQPVDVSSTAKNDNAEGSTPAPALTAESDSAVEPQKAASKKDRKPAAKAAAKKPAAKGKRATRKA
ncbi:terminase [Salmonella enterica]|nr:terminase [Salmonella enterica]EBI9231614.1 terminase [Salmonella enterica]